MLDAAPVETFEDGEFDADVRAAVGAAAIEARSSGRAVDGGPGATGRHFGDKG